MKVSIMRGLPGSGKTTHAKTLSRVIISADIFFVDSDGRYRFNPELIKEAHNFCLRQFIKALDGTENIIVDNTNLNVWEVAPYYRITEAFNCEVEIVEMNCLPNVAFARQIHGVPQDTFNSMIGKFLLFKSQVPTWWKIRSVNGV